jgi:hypothetical protein
MPSVQVIAFAFAVLATVVARAEVPALRSVRVDPPEVALHGLRDQQQLLVSGELLNSATGNGTPETADFTREATYQSLSPTIVLVSPQGLIIPRGHGKADVLVQLGDKKQTVSVTVEGIGDGERIDFRNDVIPALTRAGCNQGACHGSPQGKGGFRLSLRGFDAVLDYDTLARESFGRRTDQYDADRSLILRKALGETPHQGGIRFRVTDPEYQILRTWIHQGCRPSPAATLKGNTLTRLEVLPPHGRLPESHPKQQLLARAHFADGTVRDVTHLACFSSNDDKAATITREGVAEFHGTAEATFLVRYLDKVAGARFTHVRRDPAYAYRGPAPANLVDESVFGRQKALQIQPASLSSDGMFLRRVYEDVIGTLPTADEAKAFLDSNNPDKRATLIDSLLQRDEFAPFWALKWADLLRGSDVTISKRGVFSFHRYLVDFFRNDRPFDEFARETVTGLGNTLHNPPANFFRVARTPDDAAEAMSQLFLGVRIGCAKCHNHPFESITQNDYYGFAAYFQRVKFKGNQFGLDDEIVYLDRQGDLRKPNTNEIVPPAAFGHTDEMPPTDDRRKYLAAWLTAESNPYFARSIVNRFWFHLFGRGIVEPVDDFRETNPPSNPELLDALAADFVKHGYRIRPVLRTILNSRTYQLGSEGVAQSANAADAEKYFSRSAVRMLTGEQILDAIAQATGVKPHFEGYPEGTRAIEVAEGTIEHPFLQAFAKPVRDSTCECARDSDPSISQVIHLLNNPEIIGPLTRGEGRIGGWIKAGRTESEIVDLIYLSTLSRRPTETEHKLVSKYIAESENRAAGFADLQHALINSNEFLLRH